MKDRYPQLDITKVRFEDKDKDDIIDPEELVGFGSFKELRGFGSFKVADEIRAYQRYLELNKFSLQTYLDARKRSGTDMLIVASGVFSAGPSKKLIVASGVFSKTSPKNIIVRSGVFKDSSIALIMTNGGSFPDPIGAQLESGNTLLDCSPQLGVKLAPDKLQSLNKGMAETLSAALAVNNTVKTLIVNTDDPSRLSPDFSILAMGLVNNLSVTTIEFSSLNDALVNDLEKLFAANSRVFFIKTTGQTYSGLSPAGFTKLSKLFNVPAEEIAQKFKSTSGVVTLDRKGKIY